MAKHLFIDTETGGLNPNQHSLLTIGLSVVDGDRVIDNLEIGIKRKSYCVTAEALKVNKINLTDLDVPIEKAFPMIVNFIISNFQNQKVTLAGHNVNFDISFLKVFWEECLKEHPHLYNYTFNKIFDYHTIDTMHIANFLKDCNILKVKNVKLETLCNELNITNQDAHTALSDAIATALVYDKMVKMIKI